MMPVENAAVGVAELASTHAADVGDVVVTEMRFAAPPAIAWSALMFYEQIAERPPWYLRLLLPVPLGTEGRKTEVGDEALCRYVDGHLVKRVVRVERDRRYEFAVVEQQLGLRGVQLIGGYYALRALGDGTTAIAVATRYTSARRPRWLWRRIEAVVCHAFHRHVLRAMRRALATRSLTA